MIKNIISLLFLGFFFFSCGGGLQKKEFTTDQSYKIKQAMLLFGSKNFVKSKEYSKTLFDEGIVSGDLYYFYANGAQREGDFNSADTYYRKAIKYFEQYHSEYPEIKNRDKAYYNLGHLYYQDANSDLSSLKKAKDIWDLGLRINPKNEFIARHVDDLDLLISYKTDIQLIDSFYDQIDAVSSQDEMNDFVKKFGKIKEIDFSKYSKLIKIDDIADFHSAMPSQFDLTIQKKRKEL